MGAIAPLVVIILIVFFLASSLRVLREYQRGVVFQLGRFWKVKGPGLVILIPGIQQMVRIELRTVVLALVSVAFVVTVVRMAVRARRRPVVTGLHSMIGANGEMLEDAAGTGWASINGETWQVRVDTPLAKGRRIRVVGMNGNVPIVEQAEEGVP